MKARRSLPLLAAGLALGAALWGAPRLELRAAPLDATGADGGARSRADDERGGAPVVLSGGARETPAPSVTAISPPDAATRAAIERGLAFLAAEQAAEPDGSIPSRGRRSARLAVTALGGLAYLSAGNTLSRGPHGADLARAVDYLLSRVDRTSTSRSRGYIGDSGDKISRMHGHGFATLALAEAYTVSPRSERGGRLAEALHLAVALIESTQGLEGGWYYEPTRSLEHEGSITICLVQALRAAKGAGIGVDPQVIAKAVDYVERSQAENGGFRYALNDDKITPALTAAAISTLNAAGRYHGPEVQQGFDYLQRELAARATGPDRLDARGFRPSLDYPFYERLYLAQAYWQNPDRRVHEQWMAEERLQILRAQNDDGSWHDPHFGDAYATAINVIVLALPDQLLPILQR